MRVTNNKVSAVAKSVADELGRAGFVRNGMAPVSSQVMIGFAKSVGYKSINAMIDALKQVERKEFYVWMVYSYNRKYGDFDGCSPHLCQENAIAAVLEQVEPWSGEKVGVSVFFTDGMLQSLSVTGKDSDQVYVTIERVSVSATSEHKMHNESDLAAWIENVINGSDDE